MTGYRALLLFLHSFFKKKSAVFAILVLFIIFAVSLCAPLYAEIVGVDPFETNVAGTTWRNGQKIDIMQPNNNPLHLGLTPIGPNFALQAYMLGADSQGRDIAARLLYGGRSSLIISFFATGFCLIWASIIGICGGYFGGWVDIILSMIMDIMWAIPVYLFAISLSVVTIGHPISVFCITISSNSFLVPIFIIGLVYIPYAARPLRARALSLSQAEFVMSARGMGASQFRILRKEILPNLLPTLIGLAPLIAALCLLAESALSFLSLGVQAPAASWGTMMQDGEGLLYTRPLVAIAPGIAVILTVLALNLLGDTLRSILDEQRGEM